MKYKPPQDRIIVEVTITTETAGGIVLTGSARIKEQVAKVLAVGPGLPGADGELVPLTVKVGDMVCFTKHVGNKLEGDIWVMRESECLAVIDA